MATKITNKEFKTEIINPKHAAIVAKIVKKEPTPDQKCCPNVVQVLKRKKGTFAHYSKTGELVQISDKQLSVWSTRTKLEKTRRWSDCQNAYHAAYGNTIIHQMYMKAHKYNGSKCMELSMLWQTGNARKEGEKINWEFQCNLEKVLGEKRENYSDNVYRYNYDKNIEDFRQRIFIFPGDPTIYNQDGKAWAVPSTNSYYNTNLKRFINFIARFMNVCYFIKKELYSFSDWERDNGEKYYYYIWRDIERFIKEYKLSLKPQSKSNDELKAKALAENYLYYVNKEALTKFVIEQITARFRKRNTSRYQNTSFEFPTVCDVIKADEGKLVLAYYNVRDKVTLASAIRDLKDLKHYDLDFILKEIIVIIEEKKKNIVKHYAVKDNNKTLEPLLARQYTLSAYGSTVYLHKENFENLRALKGIDSFSEALENYRHRRVGWYSPDAIWPFYNRILRHKGMEMLAKSPYPYFAVHCSTLSLSDFEKVYSKCDKTSGSLSQRTGLNKFGLNYVEEYYERYLNKEQKEAPELTIIVNQLYKGEDITKWSEKTVKENFNLAEKLGIIFSSRGTLNFDITNTTTFNYYRGWRDVSRLKKSLELSAESKEMLLKFLKMGLADTYADIINLAHGLFRSSNPTILNDEWEGIEYEHEDLLADLRKIKSESDLVRLHDILIYKQTRLNEIYRAHRSEEERTRLERERKACEKLYEDRVKKFEKIGEKYSIIVPKTPSEIQNEGHLLHHCVGGYTTRFAAGSTNLVFLRKNESIDTPCYTIEIGNDDSIVQIHGSYNKWLGNNPEFIPFVLEWLTERNLNFKKEQLLSTSSGYSCGNSFLNAADYGL